MSMIGQDLAPRVSVALCVHNGAAFLREQVESVLAQSEPRLEVIAVDDASTDGSAARPVLELRGPARGEDARWRARAAGRT